MRSPAPHASSRSHASPSHGYRAAVVAGLTVAVGAALLSSGPAVAASSGAVQAQAAKAATVQPAWKRLRPVVTTPTPTAPSTPSAGSTGTQGGIKLPPLAAKFDYQLGGAYTPPAGVKIVERDRSAKPVAGLYNICYLNGFQTQPDEASWWQANHPELLLKTAKGAVVTDGEWNEMLLDVSTDAKRQAILNIEKSWVDGCAAAGYQAVEADNQDSYSRSNGLFGFSANKAYMTAFTAYAHSKGLAVAQKNAAEEYGNTGKAQVGFDFAIAEECNVWSECGTYTAVYGGQVLEVEYTDQAVGAFTSACAKWGTQHSIVRRDRDLVAAGQRGYAFATCS